LGKVSQLYKNHDSRKKLFILLICLGIYKLGMHIHVPFINRDALSAFGQGEGMFGMLNTFTGGALSTFSIFAVGIMPYITASIIVQLLQMDLVPKVSEWKAQGEYGERKIKQLTYGLSVIFALLQSIALTLSFNQIYSGMVMGGKFSYVLITLVLTLGTIILIILGEVIEHKGIGKGISIIILAGILMTLPDTFGYFLNAEFTGNEAVFAILKTALIILFVYALLLSIIVVNGGERKVPIQDSNVGKYGVASRKINYLPIKLNSAGVIPVIFASAMFMMPSTLLQFFGETKISGFINTYISFNSIIGIVFYGGIIVMFTFFYSFVQVDPIKLADNLNKQNQFIPGVRPGGNTAEYFSRLLVRLTFVGAFFLAIVAVLPMIVGLATTIPQELTMIGTSLIIIVSVVIDMKEELDVELTKSTYERFKSNKKKTLWG